MASSNNTKVTLTFEIEKPFTLGNLSDLSFYVNQMYNKLQLAVEGESVFEIYQKAERGTLQTPDNPLVLETVSYGSPLEYVLIGTTILANIAVVLQLTIPYIQKRMERRKITREISEAILRETIQKGDLSKLDEFAKSYGMKDVVELVDFLYPELRQMVLSRAHLSDKKSKSGKSTMWG